VAVVVRRAGRRDLEALQVLWLALREQQAKLDPRLAAGPGAARRAEEHREVILSDRGSAFFVAEDQGKLLGFLHAQITRNDPVFTPERYGEIVDLFVAEPQRSDELATRLVDYAVEWFRSHNVPEYRVWAPAAAPDAGRFFERQGAVPRSICYAAAIEDG
jgi:GNAT superfamily N-acetyltransferase